MSRLYSAIKDGAVVRRGTFTDEVLLRKDLPAPEYRLVLDEYLEFTARPFNYADERRFAYPPLSEFADAMYWASRGDDSKLVAYNLAVDAVKTAIPKPALAPAD